MYDHFIAVDWAQSNMAIARMTFKFDRIVTIDVPADIVELKIYLANLKGKKIMALEESNPAQWLYTELKDCVDELIICDPRRNRLLLEGAKNDKIDAEKIVKLLRGGLLKPVYHSGDQFIYLRKLVSGYEDVVKAGVRLKNQRSALFRGNGLDKSEKTLNGSCDQFVLSGLDNGIEGYGKEKKRYEDEFEALRKKHKTIKNLETIPGIGTIGAVKIAAAVVDSRRFANKGAFLCYCGLIQLEKISGGKIYGKRTPQYNRRLKEIFKIAAVATINGDSSTNPMTSYYQYLIREKRYPDHNARHALARRIAVLTLGVLKSGKKFEEKRLKAFQQKIDL